MPPPGSGSLQLVRAGWIGEPKAEQADFVRIDVVRLWHALQDETQQRAQRFLTKVKRVERQPVRLVRPVRIVQDGMFPAQ